MRTHVFIQFICLPVCLYLNQYVLFAQENPQVFEYNTVYRLPESPLSLSDTILDGFIVIDTSALKYFDEVLVIAEDKDFTFPTGIILSEESFFRQGESHVYIPAGKANEPGIEYISGITSDRVQILFRKVPGELERMILNEQDGSSDMPSPGERTKPVRKNNP